MTDLTTDFDLLPLLVMWTSADGKNPCRPDLHIHALEERSTQDIAQIAQRSRN
jgi:hypothetical protein